MEVYEFNKSLLDRLEESLSVLYWKDTIIPASQVRQEWAYYIELQIEPAGWQALWNIPRVICNEFQIRYPTIVCGYVEQVLFKELKAIFVVEAVQDENVHLPERHEVCLEDLWPTKKQENTALNVERTADCIDRLRFFYTNVWMPWDNDNDDDVNWVEKHLESRIRFCYDLRKRSMKRSLAAHIRQLLLEARFIQQKREYLELDLSDDEDLKVPDDLHDTSLKNKSQITDLMRLHLRLAMIRSEIELLENPDLRNVFEEIRFDEGKHLKEDNNKLANQLKHYIVAPAATLQQQLELLQMAKQQIKSEDIVQLCTSLQEALSCCDASDSIFLAAGIHSIKFLDYLNDNGRIFGLTGDAKNEVVLTSPDHDSILLVCDGDFKLENIVLDCNLVRTGISIKKGHVTLRNCRLEGNGKTSTQVALNCAKEATITLENCVIENFATGIIVSAGSKCIMRNTKFVNCTLGLDVTANNTVLNFESKNNMIKCKTGILINGLSFDTEQQQVEVNQVEDLKTYVDIMPAWKGNCLFKNCNVNILLKNEAKSIINIETMQHLFEQDFNDEECADSHIEEIS